VTVSAKDSSVPGKTQTATLESSEAAKPGARAEILRCELVANFSRSRFYVVKAVALNQSHITILRCPVHQPCEFGLAQRNWIACRAKTTANSEPRGKPKRNRECRAKRGQKPSSVRCLA